MSEDTTPGTSDPGPRSTLAERIVDVILERLKAIPGCSLANEITNRPDKAYAELMLDLARDVGRELEAAEGATPAVARVRIFRDTIGEWRWTGHASNGEPVADSAEGYKNHDHAREMAARLFADAEIDDDAELAEW